MSLKAGWPGSRLRPRSDAGVWLQEAVMSEHRGRSLPPESLQLCPPAPHHSPVLSGRPGLGSARLCLEQKLQGPNATFFY